MNSTALRHLLSVSLISLTAIGTAQLTISGSTFEPGGTSSSGGITITSIVGQPEAGYSNNGSTDLYGGFLSPQQNPILSVDLVSFFVNISSDGAQPLLSWETANEIDNIGFNIYRGEKLGDKWYRGGLITESMVPALADTFGGATYTFSDPEPYYYGSGERAYYLEDIDIYGKKTTHGPLVLNKKGGQTSVQDWHLF